ncbi:MAG: hypothetical protein ACLPKE_11795 [Streptosporangiaceae bacterium]
MDWTSVVTALIALGGVTIGLLVGWLQRSSDRAEAARLREADKQTRREEWLRAQRLVAYSKLFVLLRSLPSPDFLQTMPRGSVKDHLATAELEISRHLASLGILVEPHTAEAGFQVQGAIRRYIQAASAIDNAPDETPTELLNDLNNLYEQGYESSWGELAEVMRAELGISTPPGKP